MTARHRVLIVDDEPAVLAALQLAFEDSAGFEVLAATTAEEALVLAKRERFDLVITDKNLPGDSGLGLVRALRSDGQGAPVILITGYGNAHSRAEAAALSRVSYVEKPFANIYDIPRLAAELCASFGDEGET
ncbi:MAG: response regulator [Myxococcales bacterium]|nr:response regulator [Myxococcales bacterium]